MTRRRTGDELKDHLKAAVGRSPECVPALAKKYGVSDKGETEEVIDRIVEAVDEQDTDEVAARRKELAA